MASNVAFRNSAEESDRERPVLAWADAQPLGTPPRGRLFVRVGEREFEITGRVSPAQYNDAPQTRETWFHNREQVAVPGQGVFQDNYFIRGYEVDPGTYDLRMQQADAIARRDAERRGEAPPHPIDLLADLEALKAKPAETLRLGAPLPSEIPTGKLDPHDPGSNPAIGVVREAWSKRTNLRSIEYRELPPVVGPKAIIEMLTQDDVELSLVNGYLLVKAAMLRLDHREVIERAAPLIKAVLAGSPLRCAVGHGKDAPEAVTIALFDTPVCADHAAGAS